ISSLTWRNGRRVRLRTVWGNPWRFDSSREQINPRCCVPSVRLLEYFLWELVERGGPNPPAVNSGLSFRTFGHTKVIKYFGLGSRKSTPIPRVRRLPKKIVVRNRFCYDASCEAVGATLGALGNEADCGGPNNDRKNPFMKQHYSRLDFFNPRILFGFILCLGLPSTPPLAQGL